MSVKQNLLRKLYPTLIWFSKFTGMNRKVLKNVNSSKPDSPVYDLSFESIDGKNISLGDFRNMKILFVNTASGCGYTAQLASLQKLFVEKAGELVVIGFPSNDFKDQEQLADAEILDFCQLNYGVQFPIAKKTAVLKGLGQHPIYDWLTSPEKNGWNRLEPGWNFAKYLIDEKGVLTHYFDASVDPQDKEFQKAL